MIDWMHEQEWRVLGDLEFEIANTAILLDTNRELLVDYYVLRHGRSIERKCHDEDL